jgi:hypothetical protein
MQESEADIEQVEIEYGWIISVGRACDKFFRDRGMDR